jgi:LAS superfamily LD-carboxypeptidase LdcB
MKFPFSVSKRIQFLLIALISAAFVLGAGVALELHSKDRPTAQSTPQSTESPSTLSKFAPPSPVPTPSIPVAGTKSAPVPSVRPSVAPSPQLSPSPALAPTKAVQTLYGHFPYAEAERSRLVSVGKFVRENYSREESMDAEAAEAFAQMTAAAKTSGVLLMPISGFRSISDQQELFDRQIQRRGSAEAAAKLSAPPGHSEHHTGYAIDVADVQSPDTDTKYAFEATAAYSWLSVNAAQYGFEQSFPDHNRQGVSFEPWHWRFIQSERAAQVFAIARRA